MSTLNLAVSTVVPVMLTVPVTDSVLPVAVLSWPNSTSLTRYCTLLPLVVVHEPATVGAGSSLAAADDPDGAADDAVGNVSGGAGSDEMKWMYTNVPPTTSTTRATGTPMASQSHRRLTQSVNDIAPSSRVKLRVCWQVAEPSR